MDELLLGVDLGTTGCKAVVTDRELNLLGGSYIEYGLINLSSKEIEQDADEWWDLVKETIFRAVSDAGAAPDQIKAMSVSSQGIAFVPVSADLKPLRNAFSWLDTRADKETEEISEKYGDRFVFKTTGKRISAAYTLPKLLWFKKNEPALYEKTYKFLMPHDYIIAKLTGIAATDHTMASGTLAYDINLQDWWYEILSELDIDKRKFPEIRQSGSVCGKITKEASLETGLSEHLAICIGGQDQKCAALGAGINDDNITVSIGTASAIEKVCGFPDTKDDMKIPVFSYLFKNSWVKEGVIPASGVSLKWFKNIFMKDRTFKELDMAACSAADRDKKVFFYPYLGGMGSPEWYDDPKGCFYGIDLSTDIPDLALSVLEGTAFQIRSNIEQMTDLQKPAKEIRLFGGGASSDPWCRMIADVTGISVAVPENIETACIGASILAGIGSGVYRHVGETAERIRIKNIFRPHGSRSIMYNMKYDEYIRIQNKIMG